MTPVRHFVALVDRWPARRWFLLDGLGAGVSLGLLVVVWGLRPWFGVPAEVLALLVPLAAIFMTYSLVCWWRRSGRWRPLLMAVALGNLGYAVLMLGLLVLHWTALTPLGVAYVGGEAVVLMLIAGLEIRASLRREARPS